MFPKVLIISNTAYNNSDANGRTLGKAFLDWPRERLLLFCIKGDYVSKELMQDAYRITDIEMLNAFRNKHIFATRLAHEKYDIETRISSTETISKNAFKYVIRELIWKFNIHKTDFYDIARKYAPDIVVLQLGDSSFMIDLAIEISKQNKANLVVFTTEDYYFKTWNYIQPDSNDWCFSLLHEHYKQTVKHLMLNTDLIIANTPFLAMQYYKEFQRKTEIMMQSAAHFDEVVDSKVENAIIYAGNLSLNRHLSLIDIARVISEIDNEMVVEIYGRATTDVINKFKEIENIKYMGFVNYEKIKKRMQQMRLVIHIESFDDFYRKDLAAAFSTKISDSLACGIPFFLYAPDELAESQFLAEKKAAFICNERATLLESLKTALYDTNKRKKVLYNAKRTVLQYHNDEVNREKMRQYLTSLK